MLQLTAEDAGSRYTESHPKMQQLREQIAEAEKILHRQEPTRTQTTTGTNRSFEDVHAALLEEEPRLASLQARAGALRRQTADIRGQLKAFGAAELRIAQLQREVELCQVNYRKYSTNVEGARIDQAMERERHVEPQRRSAGQLRAAGGSAAKSRVPFAGVAVGNLRRDRRGGRRRWPRSLAAHSGRH